MDYRSQKKPKIMKHEEDLEDIHFLVCPEMEKMSHRFTTAALSFLREQGYNLDLVKPGLYEGATVENGERMHHNFKAKRANDPDAPVQTFFTQLRYFGVGDARLHDLTVECCISLGESDSLPVKRDNRGCLYCSKYVHHPIGGCKGIQLGWPTYETSKEEEAGEDAGDYNLRSKGVSLPSIQNPEIQVYSLSHSYVSFVNLFIIPLYSKSQNPEIQVYGDKPPLGKDYFSQKKPKTLDQMEDLEDFHFQACPQMEKTSHRYATAALSYLREQGYNLELVKPGLYERAIVENGARMHHNFKAKRANDPDAPVQTFFTQLRYFRAGVARLHNLTVECCVPLGVSVSLPVKRDSRGCLYCSKYVHHPIGGCKGIILGWPTYETSEEEDESEEEEGSESKPE